MLLACSGWCSHQYASAFSGTPAALQVEVTGAATTKSAPPTALLVSQTTAGAAAAAAAAPERASRCRYEAPLAPLCPTAALPSRQHSTAPLTHSPVRQFAPGVGGLPVIQQHLYTRIGTVQCVPHVVVYQHVSTDAPVCHTHAATAMATGRARPCQSARPTNSSAAARCGALPRAPSQEGRSSRATPARVSLRSVCAPTETHSLADV